MRKTKTLISLLLATALLCMLMPAVVFADASVTISASGSQDCLITLSLNISGVTADSYEYRWYHNVDNQENGTYVPICLGTGATYTLSANDIETWIKCEVTPITGGVRGATITSDKYHLEASYKLFRVSAVGASDSENNPAAYYVSIAGENILILDEYQDSVYAITDAFKGWHTFGNASTYLFDPTDSSNIGYWLNNDFLTNNQISAAMQPYLINKKWWVGGACDKAKSPYSFNAKVSLLSVDEYSKYHDRIGWGPHSPTGDWWLRNSRGWTAGPNINLVMITLDPSKKGQTGGSRTGDASCLVRPTFYLDDDIFLENKANVSTMGSGIKEMFLRRYTAEQLSSIYTDQELAQIGYDINCAYLTSSATPPAALSTLTVNFTDPDAVSYEYKWYTSSDGSAYKQIITQSASTYKVSNDDMNKYIKAVVTPVYANGTKGRSATTDVINVTSLGRVSRTGYGDDREANKSNPTANYVKLGGEELLILEEYEDSTESFFVISSHVKGRVAFDSDNTTKFDPTDSTNIGYVINNALLNGTFTEGGVTYGIASSIRSYIPTHTWWTEAGHSSSNSPSDYSVSAKIGLMSRCEYEKYWGKFGWDPSTNGIAGWWLRSGRGTGGTANTVFVALGAGGNNYPNAGQNAWANTWDKAANGTGYYIRPVFYLSEDVFKNVKADLSTMGEEVKAMLARRYTTAELVGAGYTELEVQRLKNEFRRDKVVVRNMSAVMPQGAFRTFTANEASDLSGLNVTSGDSKAIDYSKPYMVAFGSTDYAVEVQPDLYGVAVIKDNHFAGCYEAKSISAGGKFGVLIFGLDPSGTYEMRNAVKYNSDGGSWIYDEQ